MRCLSRSTARWIWCAFCFALSSLLFNVSAAAQDAKIVEPQMIGVIYYLDPDGGTLTALDREVSNIKASPGFFKAKAKLRVNGPRATFRIKSTKPEFVTQLASGVDPTKIKLYLLTVNSGKRETVIMTVVAFSGAKAELKTTTMDVTRYGQNSYKLTPAQPLVPGEYVLIATDSTDAYCFAVDAVP